MQNPISPIGGFLNVDKPGEWTSSDVVAKLRSAFQLRKRRIKIGHGGTLDPIATGVLPICVGNATRLSQYVLSGDKTYLMSVRLGVTTDTYDSEGNTIEQRDHRGVSLSQVRSAMTKFDGEIEQIPPMYSAIKINGQPLYKLARQGKTVPREPRRVTVKSMTLSDWNPPDFKLRIECGSGFYARSLAHDLGQILGCGAHMTSLRRERTGEFSIEDSIPIDELTAGASDDSWARHLLKPDYVLKHVDAICIGDLQAAAFTHGRVTDVDQTTSESGEVQVRVYGNTDELLGLGYIDPAIGRLRPAKVFRAAIELSESSQM